MAGETVSTTPEMVTLVVLILFAIFVTEFAIARSGIKTMKESRAVQGPAGILGWLSVPFAPSLAQGYFDAFDPVLEGSLGPMKVDSFKSILFYMGLPLWIIVGSIKQMANVRQWMKDGELTLLDLILWPPKFMAVTLFESPFSFVKFPMFLIAFTGSLIALPFAALDNLLCSLIPKGWTSNCEPRDLKKPWAETANQKPCYGVFYWRYWPIVVGLQVSASLWQLLFDSYLYYSHDNVEKVYYLQNTLLHTQQLLFSSFIVTSLLYHIDTLDRVYAGFNKENFQSKTRSEWQKMWATENIALSASFGLIYLFYHVVIDDETIGSISMRTLLLFLAGGFFGIELLYMLGALKARFEKKGTLGLNQAIGAGAGMFFSVALFWCASLFFTAIVFHWSRKWHCDSKKCINESPYTFMVMAKFNDTWAVTDKEHTLFTNGNYFAIPPITDGVAFQATHDKVFDEDVMHDWSNVMFGCYEHDFDAAVSAEDGYSDQYGGFVRSWHKLYYTPLSFYMNAQALGLSARYGGSCVSKYSDVTAEAFNNRNYLASVTVHPLLKNPFLTGRQTKRLRNTKVGLVGDDPVYDCVTSLNGKGFAKHGCLCSN